MKIAINITPLKTGHKTRGIGYYTENLLYYLKKEPGIEVLEFTKLSELKEADIVHYPWFDFYFRTLPIIKRFKTIVTIHDVIPLIFPSHYPPGIKGKINFAFQRLALRNVKKIISDSRVSRKDIMKKLKLDEDKIIPIPLAADPTFKPLEESKLMKVKRKYKLPDQFLLYVGDANWTKNLPFLIRGFNKLIQKRDFIDFKLVLIGGVFLKNVENIDNPELESLKITNRLIKQFKLGNYIIKPGNLDKEELAGFYNLATVYIQPSIYEGFGLPVIEAFSCGTPVICSDGGSLPEVGGEAAILFNSQKLDQFITLLEEILLDRSLQKKLSLLALKQAAKFSWNKVIRQTVDLYQKTKDE